MAHSMALKGDGSSAGPGLFGRMAGWLSAAFHRDAPVHVSTGNEETDRLQRRVEQLRPGNEALIYHFLVVEHDKRGYRIHDTRSRQTERVHDSEEVTIRLVRRKPPEKQAG